MSYPSNTTSLTRARPVHPVCFENREQDVTGWGKSSAGADMASLPCLRFSWIVHIPPAAHMQTTACVHYPQYQSTTGQ